MTIQYPDSATLEEAVLKAIKANGGAANPQEIDSFVTKELNLTQEQVSQIRSGNRTEIQYRLAWVRTKAKNRGLIEKSTNRTWKLVGQQNLAQ
jgi:restriction system protein